MSQPGRSLPDMRARDIRRRVDVIQKKLSDLQELGVPCAFCYSSVRNTGSLFTLGDHRITEVMERHKNEILKNLIESRQDVEGGRKKEIHLILPPLPAPLEELNRSMMQSLIVGILKDLGLRWSDPKPQWWPLDIPFFPPRSVPDSFKGNWTQALKRVIESVYSFFSYDVNTYIAGNLEVDVEEADTGVEGEVSGQKKDGGEVGEGESVGGDELESEDREGGEDGEEGDEEETDDGDVGKEHDTSAEDETFEQEGEESRLEDGQRVKDVNAHEKTNIQCHRRSGDSSEHHNTPCSPSTMSPSHRHHPHPQQSKTVSSFTVENILMGSTSRSGSSSSSSPGSASHAPTTTFLPFPSQSLPIAHGGNGPASAAVSPGMYGWTSHPPVKYTKFTMVSPSSMRSGGDRRKRAERERGLTVHSDALEGSSSSVSKAPTGRAGTGGDITTASATRCKEEPVSPTSSSPHTRTPTHSSSQHPSLGYHHSVIQTAIPLSRQSSAQSTSDVSPRGGHISPSSVTSIPYAASQSPQQHQQYVVFFPPNFTLMASPSDLQVLGQTSSPQLYIQNTSQSTLTNHHHQAHQYTSSHSSTSPSSSPTTSTVTPSDNPSTKHSLASAGMPHIQTSTSAKMSDPRFHPIAPKTDNSPIGFRTVKGVINDRALRKRGPKPHLPVDKMKMKKMMPKPKKLRFHMTTVVKKVKRRTTSVSMTAPPPSICNRVQDRSSRDTEASPSDNHISQDITKTPNMHTKSVANDSSITTSTVSSSSTTAPALSPENSTQHDGTHHKNVDPSESSSSKNVVDSHTSPTNSPAHPHTTVLKDSGFHLQLVKQSMSQPSVPVTAASSSPAQCVGRGRGRGRGTRGYTRRKRELTFHLYEDPTTSFRPKRTRQQS